MLIETEADQGMSNEPGSLMDRTLMGLVSLHGPCSTSLLCKQPLILA